MCVASAESEAALAGGVRARESGPLGLPSVAGGMPPAPQAAQLAGQKQSQQRYDPSTGPPVQNAASLHTPPPQLPARLPPAGLPAAPLPPALQFPPQPQTAEPQTPLPVPVKTQPPNAPAPAPPPGQLPAALHVPVPAKAQMQAPPLPSQPQVLRAPAVPRARGGRRDRLCAGRDGAQLGNSFSPSASLSTVQQSVQ